MYANGLSGILLDLAGQPSLELSAVSEGFIPGWPAGTPAGNRDPAVLVAQLDALHPWLANPRVVTRESARYAAYWKAYDAARNLWAAQRDPVSWLQVQANNRFGLEDATPADVLALYAADLTSYLAAFLAAWAGQPPTGQIVPPAPGEMEAIAALLAGAPAPTPVPPSAGVYEVGPRFLLLLSREGRLQDGETIFPIVAFQKGRLFSDGSWSPAPLDPAGVWRGGAALAGGQGEGTPEGLAANRLFAGPSVGWTELETMGQYDAGPIARVYFTDEIGPVPITPDGAPPPPPAPAPAPAPPEGSTPAPGAPARGGAPPALYPVPGEAPPAPGGGGVAIVEEGGVPATAGIGLGGGLLIVGAIVGVAIAATKRRGGRIKGYRRY